MRHHLDQKLRPDKQVACQMGNEVRAARVHMLDFAKLHEHILVMEILPSCPPRRQAFLIRHAGNFFAAAVSATAEGKESKRDSARLGKTIESLSGRTVELAATNRQLRLEIIQRKKAETALRNSERELRKAFEKSEVLKEQLRGLSRQILTAQEEERKKISRELHDVVAQALLGINVRLAMLTKQAAISAKGLARNVTATQKMITKSAETVHQFARSLRPPVLDDLGLIPALHAFMKNFTARTGVRTHLTVFAGVEELSSVNRTVLYRVVQEALCNVAHHAQASRVKVNIHKEEQSILMEVSDNGCAFEVQQVFLAHGPKGLGLLGMRERVEMIGGIFAIESEQGIGTKIIARIPVSKATEKKWRIEAATAQHNKS